MTFTNDKRLQTRIGGKKLEALVRQALSGDAPTDDAEGKGVEVLKLLFLLYIQGEDDFSRAMRAFIAAMGNRHDPLRRAIPPEQWMAIWPAINTLVHAREEYVNGRETRETQIPAEPESRSGVLGDGPPGSEAPIAAHDRTGER